MKKIDLETFMSNIEITKYINQVETSGWGYRDWSSRSTYSQMGDVWGETNKVVEAACKYKNDNSDVKKHKNLLCHIKALQSVCAAIYMNPNVAKQDKSELRKAEWELYDFCVWDNELLNDDKSVMKWFDHWLTLIMTE